jgi:hypothetical protein
MTSNADSEDGLGNPCEECGEEPSTSVLLIDEDLMYLCETCWGWWMAHSPSHIEQVGEP